MDIFFIELEIPDEKQKVGAFHHKYSRIFLKKILDNFYNVQEEIEVLDKRPYLKSDVLNFSISHSKSIIAIAFDKDKVGIDIEYPKKRNFKGLAKYLKLKNTEIESKTFYQIWTTYEAEFKSGVKRFLKTFLYKNYVCSISFEKETELNVYEINISKPQLNSIENLDLKLQNSDTDNQNNILVKQKNIEMFEFLSTNTEKINS